MSQSFLEKVADHLFAVGDLSRNTVILPTKRAGVHLRHILARRSSSAVILPKITTLNLWAAEVAGIDTADPLKIIFTCYRVYEKVMEHEAQDISEFMSWAPVMLGDFNDIESHLIRPADLFRDLSQYSEIEHFSFLQSPLTEKQENYRKFWNSLPLIHKSLNEALLAEGLGYPGLVMKTAAEKISGLLKERPNEKYIVAGFNALSAAEEKIIKSLLESGHGKVFFDADRYYLDNNRHHAGLFLRQYEKNKLGEMICRDEPLDRRKIEFNVCTSADKLDQVNAVAAILESASPDELEDTAVVLADETLVIPLLQRLPDSIQKVNVTMGIGLRNSTFADWLNAWGDLHLSARIGQTETKFERSRLKSFLDHPFTRSVFSDIRIQTSSTYIAPDEVKTNDHLWQQALTPLPADLFGINFSTVAEFMNQIHDRLQDENRKDIEGRLAILGTRRVSEAALRLKGFEAAVNLNLRSVLNVLTRALSTGHLSLVGEPLEGLQIMGVLEARALGFKHLILVSSDEDNLPGNVSPDSFIPFEVRNHHRLPGRREKESVFGYQFHRLLQHADRFDAIYHTDTDDLKGGEKSRYILQVEYGLAQENTDLTVNQFDTRRSRTDLEEIDRRLEKTPEILAAIETFLTKRGLSASSLNAYLCSPLEWYYKYVLKLSEPAEVEINAADFGTLVHHTLENLHEPYRNHRISVKAIDDMESKVDTELRKSCRLQQPMHDFGEGENLIHFETAKRMIGGFLKSEKKAVEAGKQIDYIESEKRFEKDFDTDIDSGTIRVKIRGFADRVERRDGVIRILDYKTGSMKSNDTSMKNFEREQWKKKPKAVQLLIYEWMAADVFSDEKIVSAIIPLAGIGAGDIGIAEEKSVAANRDAFETGLRSIIREMLDPSQDIVADPEFAYNVFE